MIARRETTTAASASGNGLRAASRTHVGKVRTINEDRIFDATSKGCWAIADGMGGHQGGDVAAQLVVDQFRDWLQSEAADVIDLVEVLQRANRAVYLLNGGSRKSGATAVAAVVAAGVLRVAWIGDSRAYLARGGTLRQLTVDHSLVQELVDSGLLSPAMADDHAQSHVVTRALGIEAMALIDQVECEILPGDRLLLCSDGLSRTLDEGEVVRASDLEYSASRLLAGALERDGRDNISFILVDVA